MRRAPESTEQFFPGDFLGKDRLAELGYFPIHVSIFDHCLTEEECDACDFMFHRVAVEKGKLDEYMFGERQFLALYRDLAKDGVYVEKDGIYWSAKADDPGFVRVQVESLRERTHMDVYFIGPQIRVYGGHDRTDLFLLRNKDYLPELKKKVQSFGLHTLVSNNL